MMIDATRNLILDPVTVTRRAVFWATVARSRERAGGRKALLPFKPPFLQNRPVFMHKFRPSSKYYS
jgi:hypothetical protein